MHQGAAVAVAFALFLQAAADKLPFLRSCDADQTCVFEQSIQDSPTMPPKKDDEDASDDDGTCSEPPPAQWMSGKWGIGWRIRFGEASKFPVAKLVKQIQDIPGVGYVLFGLSEGAKGARYIAPHSVLSGINPASCPERDLFDELATAFQAAGYKVLAYMATEGPAKLKHGAADAVDYDEETGTSPSVERWKGYVRERYGDDDVATLKRAYAEVIVKEYAERYGAKVDGWWFDHASTGNIPLLHEVCKGANPKAITTFNSGRLPCAQNSWPGFEDYTFGHPTPMRRAECSSPKNEVMVKAVEESEDGYLYKDGKASLGHLFMPLMERWNKGKTPVWKEEQAVDWMSRVLGAGGAWTWNVPEDHPRMRLGPRAVEFMKNVSQQLDVSCAEKSSRPGENNDDEEEEDDDNDEEENDEDDNDDEDE